MGWFLHVERVVEVELMWWCVVDVDAAVGVVVVVMFRVRLHKGR